MPSHQDEDELVSTPKSADLADLVDVPPRNESSNELSLLGEGLLLSGKSPAVASEPPSAGAFVAESPSPLGMPMTSLYNDASIGSSQSMNRPGRPPRAPPAMHPFRTSAGNNKQGGTKGTMQHQKVNSMGDYSFVSGLTDGSDDGTPPHRRSVSFDQQVFGGPKDVSESLLQPILSEASTDDLPESITMMRGPPVQTEVLEPSPAVEIPKAKETVAGLTLSDIKSASPLEAEAETAILRVLEEEEQDRGAPGEPNTVLPHLSDEAAEALREPTVDTPSKSSINVSIPRNVGSTPNSLRSQGSAKHRRTESVDTAETAMRRSKGLETKLKGLAIAMQRLRTQSEDHHHDLESIRTGGTAAAEGATTVTSASAGDSIRTSDLHTGDAMVANANALFRRSIGRQRGSLNLGRLDFKKTDGDVASQEDEVAQPGERVEVEFGVEAGEIGESQATGGHKKTLADRVRGLFRRSKRHAKDDMKDFSQFLSPRTGSIWLYLKGLILSMIFLIGVAALLYYGTDNPLIEVDGASFSWVLVFIARHLVTFTLGLCAEVVVIDYFSLRRRWTVRLLGSWASLGLVQSRGYPALMVAWSFNSFCLLSGSHRFAKHWLFWQNKIDLFNKNNPSGDITSSDLYMAILAMAMINGVVISLKRLWWGLSVGRKSYVHFGDQLAKTIEHMVLVSEVSHLSVLCARKGSRSMKNTLSYETGLFSFEEYWMNENAQEINQSRRSVGMRSRRSVGSQISREKPRANPDKIIDEDAKDVYTGRLTSSQKARMVQLLGEWEEPEVIHHKKNRVSINAILEFRQALTYMDSDYPFSLSFGLADSREACVESAQQVYERLMMGSPGFETLPFDTIAYLAIEEDGSFDQDKMKLLIRLFRPDRDGTLTMIDFVKSCDTVYKDMRLLRASIKNMGQIDNAFEALVNWVFFIVLAFITISVLGYDPVAFFVSVSSLILGFSFMFGGAAAKYFEGLLLILVRRPYDIGDRIALSDVNSDTSAGGSSTWFVQNVDLFTTTVRFATTNEVATLANGSLASSRIINGKRSPQAVRYIHMKFGVNVSYSRVQLFKKSVETFVKDRPREWLSMVGFRATRVEQDQGYIEYVIVLQHREAWQNIGPILNSTADCASFCVELAKKLEMRYSAPPLPVNLTMKGAEGGSASGSPDGRGSTSADASADNALSPGSTGFDVQALAALFERSEQTGK